MLIQEALLKDRWYHLLPLFFLVLKLFLMSYLFTHRLLHLHSFIPKFSQNLTIKGDSQVDMVQTTRKCVILTCMFIANLFHGLFRAHSGQNDNT